MDKTYNPEAIEHKWYSHWEHNGYFKAQGQGEPYCIMIPPPNVTGSLHMGHGFQNTLMDILIRYHRMCGRNTHWQVGTDHAGIATQMVVERRLAAENISRHDIGREAFIEKIWEWKQESGGNITQQLRRLGASVDWSKERFTMDKGLYHAVQEVFIRLYDEGLIYRGKRLVNWDPKLLTAISDLEVINEEAQGSLWHIRYPIEGEDGHIVIATTRPETMLGDVAIAVHPEDKRYQHLVGKYCHLPLTDRTIPIIADEYVDPEFGSGCVKITPAHDFNDYEVGKRHDLPMINIMTADAKINEHAPQAYQGLDRYDAREQIVKDLKAKDLLEKIDDHHLTIPKGDRSGVVVEPYLTDQWYMKMHPFAEPALAAVKDQRVQFAPENWTNTYNQWLDNIEDWCISRQLWWGHRIPAWYDEQDNIYVGNSEQQVREKYQLADNIALRQDDDVLDTWFSSALWPFSTLGWPEQTDMLKTFYPTSVLVSGFDIIFFWIARMIMMGLKFTGQIPFHEVYITGLIRDSDGHKMSKTKGNVLDPIDLIDGISLDDLLAKRTYGMMQPALAEKVKKSTRKEFPDGISAHGTDALRFTYCALASTGRDIRFDMGRLDGYRNFCNKIWNASRFVLMNTEDQDTGKNGGDMVFSVADKWIQSRLQDTIALVHKYIETYRFDLLAKCLQEFTWNQFCDWYLELIKPVMQSDDETAKRGTRFTLVNTLETLLRLLHPTMPFLTEEIWQRIKPLCNVSADSIMLAEFPQVNEENINKDAERDLEWMQQLIIGIRNIRGEMNISPNKALPILFNKHKSVDQDIFNTNKDMIIALAKITDVTWVSEQDELPPAASALVGETEILIPLAGLIDKDAEMQRLQKELDKIQKDVDRCEAKLGNTKFIDKAPADIVAKEKALLADFQASYNAVQEQMTRLKDL